MSEHFDYDYQKIYGSYNEVRQILCADIFHLYDTGKECMPDNSGFHNSRHFRCVAFNTKTNEMCDLGTHDGIRNCRCNTPIKLFRVYADGAFLIQFTEPVRIDPLQDIQLFED